MKILAIIQARCNSSRLEKKVLRDIVDGCTSLDYVLTTLKNVEQLDEVVIATSVSPEDDALVDKYGSQYAICRGAEYDVLDRFCSVIESYHPEHIVRVVSDNPFMPHEPIDILISSHVENNSAYSSYTLAGKNTMLCSLGLFAEVVSARTLLELNASLAKDDPYREHVTLSIYKDKQDESVNYLEAAETYVTANNQGVRLTLDTPEDLNHLRAIAQTFELLPGVNEQSVLNVLKSKYLIKLIADMRTESGKTKNSKTYEKV